MNIKGVIKLQENGLPVPKKLFLFRNPEEIPKDYFNKIEGERWAIRGFDDRFNINNSPYNCGSYKYFIFSKDNFQEAFKKIIEVIKDVPQEHRLSFVCEVWYDKDVLFSGHALKQGNEIFIDIFNGNRPSGRDWTPHKSYKTFIRGRRILFLNDVDSAHERYIQKICKDILLFDGMVYFDFTLLKDGYFCYHDLSFH